MLICYHNQLRLTQNDLVYLAFLFALHETVAEIESLSDFDDDDDEEEDIPAGFLLDVPFLHPRSVAGSSRAAGGNLATQQLAAKLECEAELGRMGIVDPFEKQRRRPLSEHVDDFENHLKAKNNSPEHVRLTMDRVRSVAQSCAYVFFDDINPSSVEAFLADLRSRGCSIQTSNHYLSAIKQFCHWMILDRRCSADPIFHLRKLNVKTDRRRDRRALESEEFTRLIDAAMNGPVIESIEGHDRAIIYIVAAWTGYRRKELASMTLRSLNLSGEVPATDVQAAYSKRRRTDTIPLHPVVLARLKAWLAEKGSIDRDSPLFPLQTATGKMRKTSKMMKRDLGRAREKWIAEAENDEERNERKRQTSFPTVTKRDCSPTSMPTDIRLSPISEDLECH